MLSLKYIKSLFKKLKTTPIDPIYTDPKYHEGEHSHIVMEYGIPIYGGTLFQCIKLIRDRESSMVRMWETSPYTIEANKVIDHKCGKDVYLWPISPRRWHEYWKPKQDAISKKLEEKGFNIVQLINQNN